MNLISPICSLIDWAFGIISNNFLPNLRLQIFFLMFSSNAFLFTFRYNSHFCVNFCIWLKEWISICVFVCFRIWYLIASVSFVEKTILSPPNSFFIFAGIGDVVCVSLFLQSLFCFIDLFVYTHTDIHWLV